MRRFGLILISLCVAACSGKGTDTSDTSGSGGFTDTVGDSQTPPEGNDALTAWLAAGSYLDWHCEAAAHDARSPSPHGQNRICSNDLLSTYTAEAEYPVGSAAVKELWDDTDTSIVGYAVYRHMTAGGDGVDWYWYEIVPSDSTAPHDANGIVADGLGDTGPANTICVACHSAAGSDSSHSGHDYVYTQVE